VKGLSARKSIPLIAVSEDNVECTSNEATRLVAALVTQFDALKIKSTRVISSFSPLDILFHQITYSLVSIEALDKTLAWKLNSLYEKAKESVPWRGTFALVDAKEYLASAIDVYYNASEAKYFSLAELRLHDSELVQLIERLIPCGYEYFNRCDSTRGKILIFSTSTKSWGYSSR